MVFLTQERILSGFSVSSVLIKELEKPNTINSSIIDDINAWNFTNEISSKIIRNDAYIVKGTSRRKTLDIMDDIKLDVLPVVSPNLKYEGIIDRSSVISQILNELSDTSPVVKELSKYLKF